MGTGYLNELLFRNKTHGTYVEVGVLCPTACSTGYFFDKELCWRGVCIDGQEKSHRATVNSERTCSSVHGVLCAHDREELFWAVSGKGAAYSGIESTLTKDHRALIEEKERAGAWRVTRQAVTCYKLETLLARHGLDHVDLLLIDIEGAEQGHTWCTPTPCTFPSVHC